MSTTSTVTVDSSRADTVLSNISATRPKYTNFNSFLSSYDEYEKPLHLLDSLIIASAGKHESPETFFNTYIDERMRRAAVILVSDAIWFIQLIF